MNDQKDLETLATMQGQLERLRSWTDRRHDVPPLPDGMSAEATLYLLRGVILEREYSIRMLKGMVSA